MSDRFHHVILPALPADDDEEGDRLGDVLQCMVRIEAKLDTLIKALAEDEGEQPELDLDGNVVGRERDQSQGLG